jgi:hypothetical protein
MRINVSTAPAPKLQAPLDAVNGRATSHTITRPEEVRSIAKEAETALDKLGLPQAHRRGARAEHVSGKGLPNAYRHTGIATRLLFERGSKAWFLVDVQRARAYPGDARSAGCWAPIPIQGGRPFRSMLGTDSN